MQICYLLGLHCRMESLLELPCPIDHFLPVAVVTCAVKGPAWRRNLPGGSTSASFGVVSFNLSLSGPGFVGHFGKEKVYMALRRKHATRTVTPCDFPVFPVVLF